MSGRLKPVGFIPHNRIGKPDFPGVLDANSTTMEPLQASLKLLSVRSLLQDTLSALSKEQAESHEGHLSRLSAALDDYAMQLSPIPLTDGFLPKKQTAPPGGSYLATLPPKARETVVRHISARPRSPAWKEFVDPDHAEALYCLSGPLADTFRSIFPEVDIGSDEPPSSPSAPMAKYPQPGKYYPQPKPKTPVVKPFAMQLRSRGWTSGARRVLESAADAITTVNYEGDGMRDSAPHLLSWIDPFREKCVNVRHLAVWDMDFSMFERLFSARPGKLESLTLDSGSATPAHLDCVARHCEGLKRLTLSSLRSAPVLLWKNLGPTLEELTVKILRAPPAPPVVHHHGPPQQPNDSSELVRNINEHCRALKNIRCKSHPTTMHNEVSTWLRSYGAQLEFAACSFSNMLPEQCRAIADGCPDAVFEILSLSRASTVGDLRFRVREIEVEGESPLSCTEAERIGTNCTELTKLTLKNMKWQVSVILSSLLTVPKPQLVDLTVTLMHNSSVQVFTQLAAYVSSLKKFKLCFKDAAGWDWDTEGIMQFLTANPGLERVEIGFGSKAKRVCIDTVVKILGMCIEKAKDIKEIIIVGGSNGYTKGMALSMRELNEMSNACIGLRMKSTHVHVLGIDLL